MDSEKHDSSHFIKCVGPGWAGLVKPIVNYVDACHNLPFNGGNNFRWGTQSIVEWLWRHWSFPPRPFHHLRWVFIKWARDSQSIAYHGHTKGFTPEIVQVKEKFGGLRVYTDSTNDFLDGMIDHAERASYYICEDCGRAGQRRDGGWILTQCDECHGKRRDN